jgi:integrase
MPSVRFYAKKSVRGEVLIMCSLTFNYQRLIASTGEKFSSKYWIAAKKGKPARAINSWEFKGDEVNLRLKNIEKFLLSDYRKQLNDGKNPTVKSMHDSFMVYLGKRTESPMTVHKFLKEFTDDPPKKLKERTLGKYRLLAKRLLEFEKTVGYKVNFDTINEKFYNSFNTYLNGLGLLDVSAAQYFKCLKSALNYAFEKEITLSVEHKKKYFKVFDENSDSIYLTMDEIKNLYSLQIEDDYLRFKRDIFILSCYTGLRFSDWGKYSKSNIIEKGRFLKVMTYKTKEMVIIPLHSIAREIFERYKDSSFVIPSNQKMNKTLKTIGQLAEMHQTMNVSSTSGGIVTTVFRMKWELITTHTARRSFATNAFLSGIPTISIMKITGHRTERSFLKYIRVSQLENAMKLAEWICRPN